jgi:exonuclease SbcD
VRAWFPDAVDVQIVRPDGDGSSDERHVIRSGRSPQELFAEYLAEEGVEDERVELLFDELLDEVS